jgi:hypothetical protein
MGERTVFEVAPVSTVIEIHQIFQVSARLQKRPFGNRTFDGCQRRLRHSGPGDMPGLVKNRSNSVRRCSSFRKEVVINLATLVCVVAERSV